MTAKYQAPKNRPKTQFFVTLISSSIMRVALRHHHESLLSQRFVTLTFRPQIWGLKNRQKVGLKDGLKNRPVWAAIDCVSHESVVTQLCYSTMCFTLRLRTRPSRSMYSKLWEASQTLWPSHKPKQFVIVVIITLSRIRCDVVHIRLSCSTTLLVC